MKKHLNPGRIEKDRKGRADGLEPTSSDAYGPRKSTPISSFSISIINLITIVESSQ